MAAVSPAAPAPTITTSNPPEPIRRSPSALVTPRSRRVVRVQPYVLVGQVAGPEGAAAAAEREAQAHAHVAVVLQIGGHGGLVERPRCAGLVQQRLAQPERQIL